MGNVEAARSELQLMHDELRREDAAYTEASGTESHSLGDESHMHRCRGGSKLEDTRLELCQVRAKQAQDRGSHQVEKLIDAGFALVKTFRSTKCKQSSAKRLAAIKEGALASFT